MFSVVRSAAAAARTNNVVCRCANKIAVCRVSSEGHGLLLVRDVHDMVCLVKQRGQSGIFLMSKTDAIYSLVSYTAVYV